MEKRKGEETEREMETSSTDRHDVFISFSTKDTRYSFVSHLSAAIRRRNISMFLGEDCVGGVATPNTDFQLPDEIQSAIEKSRVFVVVFSENYAFSPVCLETLVRVLELRRCNDGNPLVIPVFYGDVTPSIVEQQKERFGEAFSEHRSLFSEEDHMVERWRNGLIEAAKLPGHESNEHRNDSELVEEIVADVHDSLNPPVQIGRYLRLQGIENLLCKKSNDIYRLGIWGMPGIGKTTIAHAVFEQMLGDFEVDKFVENFHLQFHKDGLQKLREKYLVEQLKGKKKVIVVLDDVRNPMEAESFLGGFDCFGPASLIIITSRDKQVLYQCQVENVYEVPSLNKKGAIQLFTQIAFPNKKASDDSDLVQVSKKVIEYANGNPAALCFYGKELMGRTKTDEMEADFEKIKQCPPKEIINVFEISYDVLSDNEKSIFLDIACFFNGEELDRIMRIFEGCGFFPYVGIQRLVERSLLVIRKKKNVVMHGLIQDIARKIFIEKNNQIGMHRRLWDPASIRPLLEDKESEGTEVIEGIFLDTANLKIVVNSMAFENMYNLRLLKIYNTLSSETSQELHFPDGLHSLPYELRLLHWENYPLHSLPQDFDPSHLVELNMPFSKLQNLWEVTKSLVKLKIINLSNSQQLVEVDQLSDATSLEQIDLQGCTSLKSIPNTNRLKNIQLLKLFGCTQIQRPEIKDKVKGLDLEGGLIETKPGSMIFSKLVMQED